MNTSNFNITFDELKAKCDNGEYDTEYMEYIMDHGDNSEVLVCNGDTLIRAAESGYMYEEFVDHLWFTMFNTIAA